MTLRQVHQGTHALATARGKQLFQALAFTIIFAFALYLYFLSTTVFNIVLRKNIENNIRNKTTAISDLELSYLSKDNTVDVNLLKQEGYVSPEKTYFASRQNIVGVVARAGYDL